MTIELTPEHQQIAEEARARIQAVIAGTAFLGEALSSASVNLVETEA